ncbi:hypothetical protein SAMN07250955_101272 [Arboricoccus pini]|uniref:DUF192 domain-containing protein n=1 Tax=Arboricoccus pini TaxID=1963835 RepID=A0A212PZP5_9PROT|nr:DUF192 domain-containing protein [Arboricoccus pini]SNB52547.1 hypothetical protein SAMN07250955_101272 [Arboricoccus pini]
MALLIALMLPLEARALAVRQLEIETKTGPRHFTVEIADTDATRAYGLMQRTELPADRGMLFDFIEPQPVAFWMKDTLIPLDMLFIDKRGLILRIHKQAVPESETPIPSGFPVRAVLEIGGGQSDRQGIAVGDRVRDPIFPAP